MKVIIKKIPLFLNSTGLIHMAIVTAAHAFSEDSSSIYEKRGQINLQELNLSNQPQLTSSSYRSYTRDNTNNAVMLKVSPSTAAFKTVRLSGYGLKNSDITNKKIISHYIQKWESANLNISLSTSGGVPGAGISISNASKYWKISSYVII